MKPKILYISPPWLYNSIRSLHIARALQQVGDLEVVVLLSEGEKSGANSIRENGFKFAYELTARSQVTNTIGRKVRSLVDPLTPYPHGIGVDNEGNQRLLRSTRECDLVWFFKLRSLNMFPTARWSHSVVDIDDLPSGVYKSVLSSAEGAMDRVLARMQVFRWAKREYLLENQATVLSVCSERDKNSLPVNVPIHVIPNGFERPLNEPRQQPTAPPRIGFIGLFDYFANVQGVRWFLERSWPIVRKAFPEARLRLVGRGSVDHFQNVGINVDPLGWIDDAAAEIATWSAMIVPLHVGGGQRVKIPEGFSRKCPIVSTSLGAFGYEVNHGRELLLADGPDDFAAACISLLRDPKGAAQMAERAYHSFLEKWTWDAIAPRVWAAAEDCLRRSSRQRSSAPQTRTDPAVSVGNPI